MTTDADLIRENNQEGLQVGDFKVGDRVRHPSGGAEGLAGTVHSRWAEGSNFWSVKWDGLGTPAFTEAELEHVTAPEFKVGDTVRVENRTLGAHGRVGEVAEVLSDGLLCVDFAFGPMRLLPSELELIDTPAPDVVAHPSGEVRSVSSSGAEKGTKPERYDLLPVEALAQVARHYGMGSTKYADHNWRKGYEWSKSYAALQRHANAFWSGEDIDDETGSPHMAGVAFHALTLLTYMDEQRQFDDRWNGAAA